MYGSGAVSCSCSLLIRGPNLARWQAEAPLIALCRFPKPALRRALMPNTTIECPRATSCPTCKCNRVYSNGKRSKIVIDLRYMRYGIKRWITRYVRVHHRCPSCGSCFYARDPRWPISKYGPALAAYTVYQNIELHLPQARVASSMRQLFGLYISRSATNQFKAV